MNKFVLIKFVQKYCKKTDFDWKQYRSYIHVHVYIFFLIYLIQIFYENYYLWFSVIFFGRCIIDINKCLFYF